MIDIQYFGQDGTWSKPPGATVVDIILRGAGAGASLHVGQWIPGEDGQLTVQRLSADELADEETVEIGRPGRPRGRAGYALIVTHLADA